MRAWRALTAAILLLASSGIVTGQALAPIPELQGRVTDQAGVLGSGERARLGAQLQALEEETGAQVAMLLVESTAPETIEAFAIRAADRWRLGRQGIDDGVLIVVATRDRAVRLEVGYGLEGAIPDARARRIIDERLVPRFREADYAGGLAAGIDAIGRLVRGEGLPPPAPRARPVAVAELLPLILIVAIFLGAPLKRGLGALPGSLATGGAAGLLAWLLLGLLAAAFFAALAATVLSLLVMPGAGRWASRGPRAGGFPHFPGGFGGRGGFGGGLGGGGFSGGGGGFGGGGASGSW